MSGVTFTIARKAGGGLLSKRISLGPDGKPVSDGSPCRMWAGTARRVVAADIHEVAETINGMDSSEAMILGVYKPEAEQIKLAKDAEADPAKGIYGRTKETFHYPPGQSGLILLDHDKKGMPASVAARVEELGGPLGAIGHIVGGLEQFAHVYRPSTSSGIYNEETGERFPGGAGFHVYLLATDVADSDRFLRALQARAWREGLGWGIVAKRGRFLVRSIVDVAVGSPERLAFEGKALVVPPAAQDMSERAAVAHDGAMIDTRAVCPDPTPEDAREVAALLEAERQRLKPEEAKAKEAAAVEIAEKRGITVEKARVVVAASDAGELISYDSVLFDDPEIGEVEIADILADPDKFHGETLSDPLEGPEYGTGKAKLYANGGGDVRINSMAHGGQTFKLRHSPEYVELRVEEAGKDAPNVLASLAPFMGGIDPVTRERLRNLAAAVGKVGKRAVNDLVKQAQAKARAAEKERRARNAPRGSGKPKDTRQPLDLLGGERPAILHTIERALRDPARVEPGAVLARGQTQVVLRVAAEPVKIKGGGDNAALPTGTAYLAPAKPEHLQAQLDGHFAFRKYSKDGEAYAVDAPNDLARHVLANANLLPVMAISRTPVLRADGSVIETPGYDAATGIIYAPDMAFPPVPTSPTKDDAEIALEILRRPFRGFPFVTDTDKDAIVAELLTILVRHLVPITPAFVHNAVEAGSGKTKLFNTISTIAMGAPAPTLNAEVLRDETELRKLLTTLTLGATPFAVFDNTARGEMVASPGLANFLTAALYGDRLLGANEEVKAPTCTVLGITGNKVEIAGDLTRRVIRADLDAECERPETREVDFDCEAEARQDRGELVVAALTMLRAHALAGRPRVEGRALLGSYEDWDRLVVGAVKFAGGTDIIGLMERTRAADPERDGLAEVLAMLLGIGAVEGSGKKASEIIATVRKRANEVNQIAPTDDDEEAEARMAIIRRLGKDGAPEPRRLGRFLKKNAGRLVRGMRLEHSFDDHAKVERYYVTVGTDARGLRGKRGFSGPIPESEKNNFEGDIRNKKDSDSRGYRTDPANHANPANSGDELEDDEPWEEAI